MSAFAARGQSAWFSLSHKPNCVSHREMGRSASLLHVKSALVTAVRSSSPTLSTARISQDETSKPLRDRLGYAESVNDRQYHLYERLGVRSAHRAADRYAR